MRREARHPVCGSVNRHAAVESFAEDAVDHDPAPDQGPGREGFRAFFTALTAGFLDAQIAPAHMVADDENIAIAYTRGEACRAHVVLSLAYGGREVRE
ncbi:MAG: nuclear transport factor 2 family protein [Solirubrobacterales bacterium]|nr:nuclear transport factor 2 family protein [Solirubrobacterales bacterium]